MCVLAVLPCLPFLSLREQVMHIPCYINWSKLYRWFDQCLCTAWVGFADFNIKLSICISCTCMHTSTRSCMHMNMHTYCTLPNIQRHDFMTAGTGTHMLVHVCTHTDTQAHACTPMHAHGHYYHNNMHAHNCKQ